jgi:hypothetical protein
MAWDIWEYIRYSCTRCISKNIAACKKIFCASLAGPATNRHPGESRGPEVEEGIEMTGFQHCATAKAKATRGCGNDEINLFRTFAKVSNLNTN